MTTRYRDHWIDDPAEKAEADDEIRIDIEADTSSHVVESQRLKEEAAAMEAERANVTIIDNSEAHLQAFAARYGLRREELNAMTIAGIIKDERLRLRREFELLGIKEAPEGYFAQLQRDRPKIIASILNKNFPDLQIS